MVCNKVQLSNKHWKNYLVVFNSVFKTETLLDSSEFFFQPYWTKSGWIVYSKSDWRLYRIKLLQSSISTIPNIIYNNPFYTVNIENDNILYDASNYNNGTNMKTIMIDINGNNIDSFKNLSVLGSSIYLDQNNIIAPYYASGNLIKYKLKTKLISDTLYSSQKNNHLKLIGYNPLKKIIYFQNDKGLYQFDEGNNIISQLLTNCSYNISAFTSISSDYSKLLGSRYTVNRLTKDSMYVTNSLIELNTTTIQETVLKSSQTISTY
jgi:hypothetical protein